MAATIIAVEDLERFKNEILQEFRILLKEQQGEPINRWIKSYQVLTMLDISKNTLQMMRTKKNLKCRKVGGVYYYALEDIRNLLTGESR